MAIGNSGLIVIRAKTASLKQSMMQELLTGRTRLVTPQQVQKEVAHA